jgi:hypothetical protein
LRKQPRYAGNQKVKAKRTNKEKGLDQVSSHDAKQLVPSINKSPPNLASKQLVSKLATHPHLHPHPGQQQLLEPE